MIAGIRHRLGRVAEPRVLFPALALLMLGIVWSSTLRLIRVQRAAAERAASASSIELGNTYEAQVVRAVREIDVTLKVVKYQYEHYGGRADFGELRGRALLPPDLLFLVSIADRDGRIQASNKPPAEASVADHDYFLAQRTGDALAVGLPRREAATGEWTLSFSRRLVDAQGSLSGVAIVTVAADFFVSGYEPSKLGVQGVLGVLGTDGVFRARRTGDTVAYGETVDYAALMDAAGADVSPRLPLASPWDGVVRYTSVHELYGLPLAVVVGLSRAEGLVRTEREAVGYLWRSALASVALVVVVGLLGGLSQRLSDARRRAAAFQMEHAKQVEHLAYHDGLTGLPNRSLFSKLLQQSIQQARRQGWQLMVLFLDLDRFKHINDTLGHEAGDQLLQEVARRLQGCLRASDTVARLGGDEFVVLLPAVNEEAYATTVAHKIIALIAKPFVLLGQEFRVTGSVGIATYPQDGLDEQTLTKNADIAMYHAKEQGKNNFQFYSARMNAESLERLTLESSLRRALEHEEFELYYQVKRDLENGRITGTEALLRWRHPELGIVPPLQFLDVAEQTGLIIPIGRWVLKAACAQNVAWQEAGFPRLGVAVNLTLAQFLDEHLLHDVGGVLEASGMAGSLLELEIAESTLVHDVERSLRVLEGLAKLGVRVAVDDFGAGYTSLAALQRFPIATIKIDRSFIRELSHESDDQALTQAIIALGRALSLTVVAQGVESRAQVDFLREHACDELQGFYSGRPVPASELTSVLRLLQAQGEPAGDANEKGIEP